MLETEALFILSLKFKFLLCSLLDLDFMQCLPYKSLDRGTLMYKNNFIKIGAGLSCRSEGLEFKSPALKIPSPNVPCLSP